MGQERKGTIMADYFTMVPRSAPEKPRPYVVETADDGVVTVRPPNGRKALVFELVFKTLEGRDEFRGSRRTRTDARTCGGALTLLVPNDLVSSGNWSEQGAMNRKGSLEIAQALGVTEADVRTGFSSAWSAVIAWYQQQ